MYILHLCTITLIISQTKNGIKNTSKALVLMRD